VRRFLASLAVAAATLLFLLLPTGPASAAPPLILNLATAPCVGSSLCSPAGPAILAELAAQGGGTVATSGAALTASEAAAFSGITAGYGATATTSGSAILAAGSAGGAGTTFAGLISGGGLAILAAGVAPWSGTVDSIVAAALPPAGGGTVAGHGSISFVVSTYTLTVTIEPHASDPTKLTFTLTTPAGMGSGSTVHTTVKCGATWQTAAIFATAYWTGQPGYGGPKVEHKTNPCGSGVNPSEFKVNYGGTYSTAPLQGTQAIPTSTTSGGRYVEQTVTCKNSTGGTITLTNSTPAASIVGGAALTLAGLMCPAGYRLTEWSSTAKGTGVSDVPLGTYSSSVPDTDPCGYVGGSLCVATLQKLDPTTTTWLSCHTTVGLCTEWATDPARTDVYRCIYGTSSDFRVVGLGVCSIYVDSFPADPVADPPVITDPAPLPDPGGNNCDFGWSDLLNGTIVFKAVGCAMQWAFVPSEETLSRVTSDVSDAWAASPPGVAIDAASDVGAPLRDMATDSSPADCLGPDVNLEWFPGTSYEGHPFATCEGFPQTMSTYLRPILIAVALFAGIRGSVAVLGSTIGLRKPAAV